jgi:hypothetical protein
MSSETMPVRKGPSGPRANLTTGGVLVEAIEKYILSPISLPTIAEVELSALRGDYTLEPGSDYVLNVFAQAYYQGVTWQDRAPCQLVARFYVDGVFLGEESDNGFLIRYNDDESAGWGSANMATNFFAAAGVSSRVLTVRFFASLYDLTQSGFDPVTGGQLVPVSKAVHELFKGDITYSP